SGNDLLRGGTLVDTFVFDVGHDADEINDFEIFNDRLELSSALVDGLSNSQEVIDTFASLQNGVAVFDFGDGDRITLSNMTSLDGLADNIDIV
ncbi:calcium-binding protein, partial [Phaeobacter sp. HF9A]|nr:calcium-binding protein [Phaeobacter sp. HF9A]